MGYNLTFQQSVELAEWLAKNDYNNNILINVNQISGLQQTVGGIYVETWTLQYYHNTGLYEICTDNDDTRKWLSHIIETLFNVKNIEEEEDD